MDAEALKKGMLDALKAGRLTNAVEQVAKLDAAENDADKAAWWLTQGVAALKEARTHALAYGCKSTAAFIDVCLKGLDGYDGQNAFGMLALEAASEYADRHL